MYQLSNQVTLGKSENDIVMSIKTIGYQIMEQERLLREELLKRNGSKLEDRIMRSYGILRFARTLTSDEALQRLSDIRLGINLGLIPDLSEVDANEMMIKIQPGSLQVYAGKLLKPDEKDIIRANYVRSHIEESLRHESKGRPEA